MAQKRMALWMTLIALAIVVIGYLAVQRSFGL